MHKARVFGKIPAKVDGFTSTKITPLNTWQFIDANDIETPVEDEENQEFVAELPADEVDDFRANIDAEDEDISVDLPVTLATTPQPVASPEIFSTRAGALAMMDAAGVDSTAGEDIGVVILDAGFNRDYIETIAGPGRYGGGWANRHVSPDKVGRLVDPHERASDLHGNIVARNVLSLAPKVTLYDAPILPPRVYNMHGFSSDVVGALRAIRWVIRNPLNNPHYPSHRHWILVNAWAVATSFADTSSTFPYASSRRHRLNRQVIRLADMDNVDVVFAAGNSGAYSPAQFSGPYDRGYAQSIWGANGLEEVFTIGAVRRDGQGVGMSSQGPSLQSLRKSAGENYKPEMCAPSWFSENNDPSVLNTGTSTSCALFSGLLASIRSRGNTQSSADLKQHLMNGASEAGHWNAQTGVGLPAQI